MDEVIIVKTGVANTASVIAALKRQGTSPRLSHNPEDIARAKRVVIPGVGSFGSAMQTLREQGLVEVLQQRYQNGLPTLSICVGLQILARASEESPGAEGLGIIPSTVKRFGEQVRVPQFGWNLVVPDANCRLIEQGHAYFANSFYLEPPAEGFAFAKSNHGTDFVAALERGPVLACQFHLELSGTWGAATLDRWLRISKEF